MRNLIGFKVFLRGGVTGLSWCFRVFQCSRREGFQRFSKVFRGAFSVGRRGGREVFGGMFFFWGEKKRFGEEIERGRFWEERGRFGRRTRVFFGGGRTGVLGGRGWCFGGGEEGEQEGGC